MVDSKAETVKAEQERPERNITEPRRMQDLTDMDDSRVVMSKTRRTDSEQPMPEGDTGRSKRRLLLTGVDNPGCKRSKVKREKSPQLMPDTDKHGPDHAMLLAEMVKSVQAKSNIGVGESNSTHWKMNGVRPKQVELRGDDAKSKKQLSRTKRIDSIPYLPKVKEAKPS